MAVASLTLTKLWSTPYAVAYSAVTGGAVAGVVTTNVDAAGAAGPATPDLINDTAIGSAIRYMIANQTDRWTRCAAGAGLGLAAQGWGTQAAARTAFGINTNTGTPMGSLRTICFAGAGLNTIQADLSVVGASPADNLRLVAKALDDGANVQSAVIVVRVRHSVGR
jgi:hypothetical protein